MLLRKWRSNSKQLNLLWQQEGVKTESSETSAIDLRPPTKVLGLAWDPENDLIYFDPKDLLKFMSRRGESKRFILSVVGRIFDPIGILGPFVIKLKCLLQELWTLGVEWDSELPPKLRHKWQQWSSEAEGLTEKDTTVLFNAKLYQLQKNLLAPDIPSDQTLDKLKDALKKHLTPKPLIIPSRHKFLNRKQTEGEGEINNYEAKLKLRHGVKPIFCRVRTVPFALKGRVENEIDRLEKEGIIEKVDSSEWATPVVPVVKSDGSIRLSLSLSLSMC
ncbi:DUF1758 domain-containing protein [Trichonephila clavipes]|nr:DUF1758 domain-containing protein [Trichonephila clavipes]